MFSDTYKQFCCFSRNDTITTSSIPTLCLHCKQRVGIEDVVHPNSFTVDSENDNL